MNIAVIGAGNIGLTVGKLWLEAGHDVVFGTRDTAALAKRLRGEGVGAEATDVAASARRGEVVFAAIPYGVWPEVADAIREHIVGKIVIDAANPSPARDGRFASDAAAEGQGAGVPVARLMPRVRLVRAFSTVYYLTQKRRRTATSHGSGFRSPATIPKRSTSRLGSSPTSSRSEPETWRAQRSSTPALRSTIPGADVEEIRHILATQIISS